MIDEKIIEAMFEKWWEVVDIDGETTKSHCSEYYKMALKPLLEIIEKQGEALENVATNIGTMSGVSDYSIARQAQREVAEMIKKMGGNG